MWQLRRAPPDVKRVVSVLCTLSQPAAVTYFTTLLIQQKYDGVKKYIALILKKKKVSKTERLFMLQYISTTHKDSLVVVNILHCAI